MPAQAGRDLVIVKNSTAIAGARTTGLSMSGEPIDITSGEDSGIRTLLDDKYASKAVELTVEGVWKDSTLRTAALSGSTLTLTDIVLNFADGGTLSGDFFLSAYSETGAHDDSVQFSATLISSGAWVVA